ASSGALRTRPRTAHHRRALVADRGFPPLSWTHARGVDWTSPFTCVAHLGAGFTTSIQMPASQTGSRFSDSTQLQRPGEGVAHPRASILARVGAFAAIVPVMGPALDIPQSP